MGLFDVKNTIKVCGIEIKEITYDVEKIFLEFLMNNEKERVSFYSSFYYLYPISNNGRYFKYYYCILDDYLCIYEYSKGSKMFGIKTSPINRQGDYSELNKYLFRFIGILSKLNKSDSSKVMYANNIIDYEMFNSHKTEKDYKEFVFMCSDLINLQGKKYKSRRHMVNKFKSDNPDFVFRRYDKFDYSAVNKIYDLWVTDYKTRYPNESISNEGLFKCTMDNVMKHNKNYDAFVCEINNKIEGIIVITPLCKDTCSVLLEYTNLEIVGMTEFMWYESLRYTQDKYVYENDGTGGPDTDGLFAYKNSHKPIMFLETKTISLNKRGHKIKKSILKEDN